MKTIDEIRIAANHLFDKVCTCAWNAEYSDNSEDVVIYTQNFARMQKAVEWAKENGQFEEIRRYAHRNVGGLDDQIIRSQQAELLGL